MKVSNTLHKLFNWAARQITTRPIISGAVAGAAVGLVAAIGLPLALVPLTVGLGVQAGAAGGVGFKAGTAFARYLNKLDR